MSWLSTSLSENLTNITGQISTFTKDMLTEGTEEVRDHETELKIAKARLRELELSLYTQREEYDRVKELNHELQERAEAAELQISSISREYRILLESKENDLVELREQLELLKEQNTRQDRERFPSFGEDSFVSGSSHEEIQHLKAIIDKLQAEKKALTKKSEKENLHKELDHYQHELATLHSTYSQRIASLNKKHKEELEDEEKSRLEDSLRIDELEKQLAELRQSRNQEISAETSALKEALENSENTVRHLNQELESLRKSSTMEEEHDKKSSSHSVESQVDTVSDFELIDKEKTEQDMQMSSSMEEEGNSANLSELKALIDQLQRENQDLTHQRDQAVIAEEQTSASLESLKEELSSLGMVTMELMKEVEQSQGVDKEKSIEIESLKKICQFRGDGNKEEVVKLKDMLAVLWKKYAAVVLANEKVRLELHNVKQRLLFQLQDRHGDTRSIIEGIGDVRTKLEGKLDGHREVVHTEKEQLASLIPEVESDVQEQEECVSRLQQENEQTIRETKDIVSDIGKMWSTNNLVASLQAEKAVLERTIVGLEEKVEELQRLLENRGDWNSPRSSVSTVISIDTAIRAASELSEPGEDSVTQSEAEERGSPASEGEHAGVLSERKCSENVVINKLQEKLKDYEETIQEFELIREDWEGEKEALEGVVVELRNRLKDASLFANVETTSRGHCEGNLENNVHLNEIQEWLIEKNRFNKQEFLESTNGKSRADFVLLRTLEWLRQDKAEKPMTVSEGLIKKQESNAWFGALDASPDGSGEVVSETEFSENLSEKLYKSEKELEKAANELSRAVEERAKLESKLKFLEKKLEESHENVNSALSEKNDEIYKLRNVAEQLRKTLSDFQNHKDNDLVALKEENGKLQRELGEAATSYETMSALAAAKEEEVNSVMEEKTLLKDKVEELNVAKERLVSMVNERDERIEELQDVCDSADQRANFLQEEGKGKTKAFNELSEEFFMLKEEKAELFSLLEEKDTELNSSLRENDKLSELLHQQELASEEIKKQNTELAQDLEKWRLQMEELNQAKETLNHDLDAKVEEILMLKENNIELLNQSFEYTKHNREVSEKLNMFEQLVSENSTLKSEKEALMEAISRKEISEKELKDSYNLMLQEKQQLELSFSQKLNECEKEIQRKVDEAETLRLEVGRLTKETQEKDQVIRAQVSSNLVSGDVDDAAAKQEHVRRILEEKDVEITALKTKNESLVAVFAENEQNNAKVSEQHDKQIRAMLEQQERMLAEINEKTEQLVALEDKLEMIKIKAASKDKASALIHAEHQKLLHLNESQGEEIGKLREKVSSLGLLVAEKDHGMGNEVQRLHQLNADLQQQVAALQGEQERLLTLVHEKDKQLSGIVHEAPFKKFKETVVNELPSQSDRANRDKEEYKKYVEENAKLTEEMISLRTKVTLLNDLVENERNTSKSLHAENETLGQRLLSLEKDQTDAGDQVVRLQRELKKLKMDLSTKMEEISSMKEDSERESNRKMYEINCLKNEKNEILLEQNSRVEELQRKLSTLLEVISSDEGFIDEQFEILEDRQDFQRLLSKVRSHRARLISEKDNEVRLLKEQVQTLSSVQNISTPELERKVESFIKEKDEMSQKLLELQNAKLALLDEKENELASLQTQVLNLSSVLKQKERQWLIDKENLNQENVLLDNRIKTLQDERDSLLELKAHLESEAITLREEISSLSKTASQKQEIVVNEKDRRIKELEIDVEELKERHARSAREVHDLMDSLNKAKELANEFETKKEKELERLRTHLLQVEDSYTQEALASEEREKELRTQLDRVHKQLMSSSHSLQDSNRTATMKMENLQEQLMNMTAHRDELLAQLEQSQEQSLQYMRSVENLQMVLEQFQREKESEIRTLHENNRKELNEAQREAKRLLNREAELQELLQNASDALNKADQMGEDLRSKEEEIEVLKTAVANLESDLQSSHDKIRQLTSNNDGKIEKSLMKNMLMAYFNTVEQKRPDVVVILGHILNFTDEEIKKVGSGSHPPQSTGWLSGLLSYSGANQSRQHDKTFSELFVSFLEKESESQIASPSGVQPSPAATLPRSVGTTVAPVRPRAPVLPVDPLATSTPHEDARPVSNPLLINARMDGVVKESSGSSVLPSDGNPLLGSSLRPSLNLPSISNSSSSSSALRKILFND